MTTTDHDLARQIAAMRTELREVRRLIEQLATQPTTTTDTAPEGVQHLPNGDIFLPGTGTITRDRPLSPEAQTALNQLDHDPTAT